jgi:nifR3 family TIM-barrel protein
MKLGKLQLSGNLVLAPMSGITDYCFRRLVKEMGCGLVFTEMVSAEGLLRKGESFLKIEEEEHPVSVQLFGADPEILAEAAQRAEGIGADAIDINMGCPANQIIKTGAGADLMQFPDRVRKILIEVRKEVKVPLMIKIRSGWDNEHINAIEISKIAEDCGVDVITLHPRTRTQGFHGRADWNLIGKVKRMVHVPVIGNGDVTTPFLAKQMLEETGCDGVMIGRGALGNPWIFRHDHGSFLGSLPERSPSLKERLRVIEHHFSLLQAYYGDKKAIIKIQKHVYWYTRGFPGCASFHAKLSRLKEKNILFDEIYSYFDSVQRRSQCQSLALAKSRSVTGLGEEAS